MFENAYNGFFENMNRKSRILIFSDDDKFIFLVEKVTFELENLQK